MRFVIPLIVLIGVGCGTSAPPEEATEVVEAAVFDEVAEFTEAGHTTDSLSTVKERLAKNEAVLIDVREQSEWDAGHLNVATLIPMSVFRADGLTDDMKQSLPTEKPIYLHCKSGGRVLKVAEILRAEDLDVRPLKAGYDELVEQGFE
jgi:hydroxyacylglutathione hydrolase